MEIGAEGPSAKASAAAWRDRGLLLSPLGGRRFRAVTHYGIERRHIEEALAILAESGKS